MPPNLVGVDRTCTDCGAPHGRPVLSDTDLKVSLSHAGHKVVVAMSRLAPVGVDLEPAERCSGQWLARTCLAPGETMVRPEDFLIYWCRKESVVKATGDGLRVPLSDVVVSAADQPAYLVSYRGRPLTASIVDVTIVPGYVGAVTVLADGHIDVIAPDTTALLDT
jgi:4'-phosphopantetheinyl transferase